MNLLFSEKPQTIGTDPSSTPTMTVEIALERARRAFALRKYEQAIELYATALELQYVLTCLDPANS